MNQALLSAVRSESYNKLLKAVTNRTSIAVTGLPESMASFLSAKLCTETGKKVLLLSANDLKASHDADDAQQLLEGGVACLPGGEIDLTRGASSHESAWRRLETLARVQAGKVRLLCTSMDAAMQRMGSAARFREETIRLMPGSVIDPNELIRRLTAMGYERVSMVEGKGQCAMRGGIVDVYPPADSQSLRIEFFDDEVDSIRAFDCISQRSLDAVDDCMLTPAAEVLLDEEQSHQAARRMRDAIEQLSGNAAPAASALFSNLPPLPEDADEDASFFDKTISPKLREKQLSAARKAELERRRTQLLADADLLEAGVPFKRIRAWLSVLTDGTNTIADWFVPDLVVLSDPNLLRKRSQERITGFAEDLDSAIERGEAVKAQESLLMDWDTLLKSLVRQPIVAVTEFLDGMAGVSVKDAVTLNVQRVAGYSSQLRPLAEDCDGWLREGCRIAVLCGGVARGQRLVNSLQEYDVSATFSEHPDTLPENCIQVLPGTLSHGFIWEEAHLVVISDADVYGSGYRKARKRQTTGEKIAAFTDLKVGDYVVHEEHGIGIYMGTAQMTNGGTRRDYLQIQYAGSDKLYVPIEALSRVQRYIGTPPAINRLGGGDWQKQKAKVKEGLQKMAFDLVRLYAQRSQETGFAFSPDTPWQREFEDMFPYELTPDQEQSIREITADMESPRNMDRLLCGDVGYGKTEVSLRAAFKALMDTKQVAILAPTTILAQQHYNTVVRRFSGFPVRIEVLSRFRTQKEVKDILARLSEGKIDILIGTHRILGKDVHFKNLGLLIVDEEQRFGVQHKEIIKHIKHQVDVLTLSATPIPRTLHMSMVGIRDMSVLETPPEDRLPVQTRVIDYNDGLIRDAILREVSRGGQVYFLYNAVQSIGAFYDRLKQLVPEVRIGIAHGQMREHELEDVMMDFYGGSYDVLLCTTIIESGLDVPTANTLIVFDADRFGLSQLYQIRGRVGRSNRQAYAYFTVRPERNLSETAEKRLEAIREFTEFGAGFRIAMRDLEIRGAGNILGPEQHGHLAAVGYEMYCKLMEETLKEARAAQEGLPPAKPHLETRIDLKVDAYLPNDYVQDDRQRMEMYKRIASLTTQADREDITDELLDRFGPLPHVVETLLDVSQLRVNANQLGISLVSYKRGGFMVMRLNAAYMPEQTVFIQAMAKTDKRLMPSTTAPDVLLLVDPMLNERAMLAQTVQVLKKLNENIDIMLKKQP